MVLLSRYRLVAFTFADPGMIPSCTLNVLGNYLGMLLTLCSNGRKGNYGKGFLRFAYAFYPLHFLLLALVGFLRTPFLQREGRSLPYHDHRSPAAACGGASLYLAHCAA